MACNHGRTTTCFYEVHVTYLARLYTRFSEVFIVDYEFFLRNIEIFYVKFQDIVEIHN